MGVHTQLCVDVGHVGRYGVVRDAQGLLDVHAVAAGREQLEDLGLARGQLVIRGTPATP